MKSIIFIFFLLLSMINLNAQGKLPYHEIPTASNQYNAGTVASRMIDGLGFRYFWATDSLRAEFRIYTKRRREKHP